MIPLCVITVVFGMLLLTIAFIAGAEFGEGRVERGAEYRKLEYAREREEGYRKTLHAIVGGEPSDAAVTARSALRQSGYNS